MTTIETIITPNISNGWLKHLSSELKKPYFVQLEKFLIEEKKRFIIYPPLEQIFNAYQLTPFDGIKVVILGQDPYHGPGQAHGLSFSVRKDIKIPPSLVNIFKELHSDYGIEPVNHGNLTKWATQGVLLLNSTLTVRDGQPASHAKKGWEQFTDASIKLISEQRNNIVFMLWGKHAHDKKHLINSSRHLILEASHPSPFSAHKGFFGCKHFSKANLYLSQHGIAPIQWQLSE